MYLLKISQIFLFLFFGNEFFRNIFPKQHNNLIIFIVYNSIYYLSKVQIKILKLKTKYPILKKLSNCYFINKNDVEFILDGIVIYKTNRNQINDIPTKFDFIIYSDYTNDTNDTNDTIINKCILNVLPNNFINYNYTKTDYKFILLEIEIDNKKIKLDLQTDTYNFFICDNIIHLKFLHYFLNTYYKSENINFENKNIFKINLIDHNMNSLSTNSIINIRLNKTNYDFLENNNENNNQYT